MEAQCDACTLSHVVDFYRRYPGEDVTFYTRVQVRQSVPGFALRVSVPHGLEASLTRAPGDALPQVVLGARGRNLSWNVAGEVEAGACYEYQVQARVLPTRRDETLESQAVLDVKPGPLSMTESVSIVVPAQGGYLEYLPALYQRDELMGRFLMLFESFWLPIEGQIEQFPLYFDPRMTPPDFLPWLASWLDLALDERWPEERRRLLLRSAASLYRKRGTKQGLQDYLEIFTGDKAEIIEHRANNFCLGPHARLGPGVALGTLNMPHTFTVVLHLPDEGAQEAERLRIVEAIIEAEKPAHTSYTVRVETRRVEDVASTD